MAKEGDMSLFNDVLEPFRRVINTDPPKDKLSASNKLNFSDSNSSLKEGITNLLNSGKRKASLNSSEPETPGKRIRTDSSSNVPPSPWESKRLKIDLIAAKAQIAKLESRINHQHQIFKEMQILFEGEKGSLVEQHKRDERAISDLEDRLTLIRKREQDLREEFGESVKDFNESKAAFDKEKLDLQKQVEDLKDKLLEVNVSSADQISEMQKDMNELLAALESAQEEAANFKSEVEQLKIKSEQCTSLRNQLEKQTFEFQQVTRKLKQMEYERDSYQDWQTQAKTAQKRLSNMAELEKEVTRLRATERSLRDTICNTLLLEEQVHVKLASLESSLEEWRSAAQSHGVENARALSAALDAALSGQMSADAATLKFERDKVNAKLNDLLTVRKNQESLIHRLQKRLLLVTRERDSYRQQLDSFEKELTVTLSGETGAGGAALLQARVEQLERSLQGYRDLLATQDQESQAKGSAFGR
ncbi:unnamed protein product [Leptidea sinapis]|uniref:Uncharacterized protein n=1 Tax=Leptidea sinapis TaxID=189913 RepID=A0A5E4Q8U5_9NEOP|nr:unnamed protein product [Leptidea sinapis]